jgi:hypothetical protein
LLFGPEDPELLKHLIGIVPRLYVVKAVVVALIPTHAAFFSALLPMAPSLLLLGREKEAVILRGLRQLRAINFLSAFMSSSTAIIAHC